MNIDNLSQSVADLRKSNRRLTLGVACIGAAMLLLAIKMMFTNVAIINRVPGMPDGARIERNGMDVGAKQATAYAVTNAIASLNPSNGDSVKSFLQPFLSSDAYTKVTQAIDLKVATLKAQRELGSRDPSSYIWGGPATVAEALAERHRAGATHLVLTFPKARDPSVYALLAEAVRPLLL